MYLVISEDGSPTYSKELTDELIECSGAGVIDIYKVSGDEIMIFNHKSEWELVEEYESFSPA